MEISLDIRKSPQENADLYYKKAKKARRKILGAKKALEETIRKIEKLKAEKKIEEEKREIQPKKVHEKKWYEKFRHFFSSDNFLVIGGKDATSNEVIIKKYMEKDDLVFHADIHGAPFFIIKNTEKKADIPEQTKRETAEAAASYSKAWSLGLGNCNVYFITPEQVSKKAPSGEYIGKGAFMISGTKNWFRNVELKIAVGVSINEEKIEVIGGPVRAVNAKCKYFTAVKPGQKKSKELAQEIKKAILRKATKEDGERIKKEVSLEEIQRWIPSGKGEIFK